VGRGESDIEQRESVLSHSSVLHEQFWGCWQLSLVALRAVDIQGVRNDLHMSFVMQCVIVMQCVKSRDMDTFVEEISSLHLPAIKEKQCFILEYSTVILDEELCI
jgi:hypothetical protein